MRDMLINLLAQKVGWNSIPKTQKEFFDLVANNSKFQEDLQRATDQGYVRQDNTTGEYIFNMDKINELVRDVLPKLF